MGMGKPCNEEDMKLLYAFINVYIGNGKTAKFWHCPWLGGAAPKDIAPPFFPCQERRMLRFARGWSPTFGYQNFHSWETLTEDPDSITWKLTASTTYS
jgi:hypothetical protein